MYPYGRRPNEASSYEASSPGSHNATTHGNHPNHPGHLTLPALHDISKDVPSLSPFSSGPSSSSQSLSSSDSRSLTPLTPASTGCTGVCASLGKRCVCHQNQNQSHKMTADHYPQGHILGAPQSYNSFSPMGAGGAATASQGAPPNNSYLSLNPSPRGSSSLSSNHHPYSMDDNSQSASVLQHGSGMPAPPPPPPMQPSKSPFDQNSRSGSAANFNSRSGFSSSAGGAGAAGGGYMRDSHYTPSYHSEAPRHMQQSPPLWALPPKQEGGAGTPSHLGSYSSYQPSPMIGPHHALLSGGGGGGGNPSPSDASLSQRSANLGHSSSVPMRETYEGGSRAGMIRAGHGGPVDYQYSSGFPHYSSSSGSLPLNSSSVMSPSLSDPNPSNGYGGWPSLSSSTSSASPGLPSSHGQGRMLYQDDESRWEGVANRSHHADRYYLYGALTTHIYCRPSCASKRPSRDRVQFFPYPNAAAAAEAAGFRSCKRCKPDRSGGDQTVLAVGDCVRHMMMAAASSAKEGGEPKKRTLKEYAARAGLSTFHFHRSLAKVMSITPGEYAKACQSLALQDALGMDNALPGQPRITSKIYDDALTGWSARRAKRALGNIDPGAYTSGDLGLPIIRTSVQDTVYGPVSLVYTAGPGGQSAIALRNVPPNATGSSMERVIFALLFGQDADARLARRFPSATPGDFHAQQEIRGLLDDLRRTALREEQLPPETVPSIRRARLWATVRKRLVSHQLSGQHRFSDIGAGASGEEDHYE